MMGENQMEGVAEIVEEDTMERKDDLARPFFSNATIDPALSSAVVSAVTLQPPEDRLALWKRRLITHEDPFSIHKLAR